MKTIEVKLPDDFEDSIEVIISMETYSKMLNDPKFFSSDGKEYCTVSQAHNTNNLGVPLWFSVRFASCPNVDYIVVPSPEKPNPEYSHV